MRPVSGRPLLAAFLVAVLTALAYWPGTSGGFLFDDYPTIVHQPAVQMDALEWPQVRDALLSFRQGAGRPLATLSLAIDFWLWDGEPFGFKLTGLLVHVANALLVLVLARQLLERAGAGGPASRPLAVATLLALLWALHPLQVSTVLYVVQRMETLATLFVLAALVAYVAARGRQARGERAWPLLLVAAASTGLGLACKENAALLPFYALVLELTLLRFAAADPRTATAWKAFHALAAAAAVAGAVLLWVRYAGPEAYAIRDFGAWERVLTQFRVLPLYLGWILLPRPGAYHFYYDNFAHSTGWLAPATTFAGAVLLLALAVAAWRLRRRAPLFATGIAWFFVAHAVTSSFLPLELVFEHRNYLALFGIVLAGAGLLPLLPADARGALPAVAAALLAGVCLLTLVRTATWGAPLNLAMALAQANPGSARASTGLGDEYLLLAGRGDPLFLQLAEQEYERGAALPGSSPMPEQGLLLLAATTGRPARDAWWDSALAKLETRAIGPQEMSFVTSLLDLRLEGLPIDDRRLADAYVILANRMQVPASQYFAFGVHATAHLGDRPLADGLFRLAVDHAGGDARLVQEMVGWLGREGHHDAAASMAAYAREGGLAVTAAAEATR